MLFPKSPAVVCLCGPRTSKEWRLFTGRLQSGSSSLHTGAGEGDRTPERLCGLIELNEIIIVKGLFSA